jgi:hypothetical protein
LSSCYSGKIQDITSKDIIITIFIHIPFISYFRVFLQFRSVYFVQLSW